MKKTTYNGTDIFGINFNLYNYEGIRFEASKQNILSQFKFEYQEQLIDFLPNVGLKFSKLTYFSPKQYNYMGDAIDLSISIIDAKKYIDYIGKIDLAIELNRELAKNKSYDGYMALTVDTVFEEIEKYNHSMQYGDKFEPDALILGYIICQKIDFTQFDINEFVLLDYRLSINN